MAANKSPSLERALLDKKIITREQYDAAEHLRVEQGGSLEDRLIDLKILSRDDIASFYGDILQVRLIKLEDVEIDPEATRHIPAHIAHKYHLIPIRRSGNTLAVVMENPIDHRALEALRSATDFEIVAFLGQTDAIEHAMFVHYGDDKAEETDGEASDRATAGMIRPALLQEDERFSRMGRGRPIDPKLTFDQLVEDKANQFALSIARSVAEQSGDVNFNPALICGPSGLGKSHLLHAVANYSVAHWPLKRLILTNAEEFGENFATSLFDQKINLFRYFYREVDTLLIDDCDTLLTKPWAQRELAQTGQELRRKGKRLVVTSVSNLISNPRVIPELVHFIESGAVAQIEEYSMESKVSMLQRRMRGADLSQKVLEYMARRVEGNVRNLFDVFQQALVLSIQGEREISEETVDSLMAICGYLSTKGKGI